MKRPTVKTEGFTLIELLIVVVILSTLAAIVVPQFANSSDSARIAATKSSLSGIRSALETYRNDKGGYPLEKVPTTKACTTAPVIAVSNDEEYFVALMLYYSDETGQVCASKASHPHGPYLRAKTFPGNPLDQGNFDIKIDKTTATLGLKASNAMAWNYQAKTGEFIADQTEYENY